MKQILAALLVFAFSAHAADGGVQLTPEEAACPRVVDVERARITQPDGGVVDVVGGGWLRTDTLIEAARRDVKHTAEVTELEQQTMTLGWRVATTAAVLLGAAFAAGYAAGRIVR